MGSRTALGWALLLISLAVSWPAAGQDSGPVTLRAEHQKWMRDNYWRGEGNVEVSYQDIEISCHELEIDLKTLDLTARGEVILDQGPQRLTASEVTFNLRDKVGTFRQATGNLAPTYHFTADELIKLDDTRYRILEGTFTSCEIDQGAPPWEFGVRKATLEEEGYGHFHGATLRIKRVPIFYWPYVVWPIKTERAAGFLVPSFGYSSRRGAYLGTAWFQPLGRSYDTTFYLDAYSMGSIGLGNRWRWAPTENAYGEVELYSIYDHLNETFEWKVHGSHEQDDLLGFRVLSEVHDVSDIDFFREFERSYDRNTLRSLYSYVYLTRSAGPGSLNIRFDRRKTFLSTYDVVMNQLPEAEYRVPDRRIGHSMFYWSLISSMALFDVDKGNDLETTYGRADLFPSLSYSVPTPPWLSVTPRVGGRATYYTSRRASTGSAYEDEGLDRSYVTGGMDIVGPSFSRIFESGIGKYGRLKHLIEPRVAYSYVSDPGDRKSVPVFDEVDSVLVTNRARLSVVNTLYGRSEADGSVSELGSFELAQEYSFGDPLNRSSQSDLESQRGPLEGTLRLTPAPWLYVDARARYDTLFEGLRSTSFSTSLRGQDRSMALTWYQAYMPEMGERTSSQARLTGSWGGYDDPIQIKLSLAFDVEENEFVQQRAIVRYVGSCWGVSVEYRDYQYGLYPTRDYRISIDFKGIGKFIELQGDFESGDQQL